MKVSSIKIEIFNDSNAKEYERYILNQRDSCIYHTLEWRKIIQNTYRCEPMYLLAFDDEEICGVLPLFLVKTYVRGTRCVSIPLSHHVPVLYQNEFILKKLLDRAKAVMRHFNGRYVEIRNGQKLDMSELTHSQSPAVSSILDLSQGVEKVWDGFGSGSVKWRIRKAEKEDFEVKYGNTLDDYRLFYEMEISTRKRQGMPVYPFKFFHQIYELLGKQNYCKLYIAYQNKMPHCGVLTLEYNGKTIYGYGASFPRSRDNGSKAIHLALWKAIQDACERKDDSFDFGTSPHWNKGLITFKSKWGTQNSSIYYQYITTSNRVSLINRQGASVFWVKNALSRLPKPIFCRASSWLLKESF